MSEKKPQSWLELYRAAASVATTPALLRCMKVNLAGVGVECFLRAGHPNGCSWTLSRDQLLTAAEQPARFQPIAKHPLEVVSLRLAPRHVEELDRRARDHGGNRSAAVRAWLDGK